MTHRDSRAAALLDAAGMPFPDSAVSDVDRRWMLGQYAARSVGAILGSLSAVVSYRGALSMTPLYSGAMRVRPR
jgi:hypothetical protein